MPPFSDMIMSDKLLTIIFLVFISNLIFTGYTNSRIDSIVKDLKDRIDELENSLIGKR